jgi:hypothetical protein
MLHSVLHIFMQMVGIYIGHRARNYAKKLLRITIKMYLSTYKYSVLKKRKLILQEFYHKMLK